VRASGSLAYSKLRICWQSVPLRCDVQRIVKLGFEDDGLLGPALFKFEFEFVTEPGPGNDLKRKIPNCNASACMGDLIMVASPFFLGISVNALNPTRTAQIGGLQMYFLSLNHQTESGCHLCPIFARWPHLSFTISIHLRSVLIPQRLVLRCPAKDRSTKVPWCQLNGTRLHVRIQPFYNEQDNSSSPKHSTLDLITDHPFIHHHL
jgi:hypothetical protein